MEISESGRQKKKEFERIYNHFLLQISLQIGNNFQGVENI